MAVGAENSVQYFNCPSNSSTGDTTILQGMFPIEHEIVTVWLYTQNRFVYIYMYIIFLSHRFKLGVGKRPTSLSKVCLNFRAF